TAQVLLQDLLKSSLIRCKDWDSVQEVVRENLEGIGKEDELLAQLVEQKLLTEYQAARVGAGTTFGLVLGNYRVLDRLGAGAMGVVFMAEHMDMRRRVAIKVLALSPDHEPLVLRRFYAEMRAVSQLQHPNIV